jgi:hypothetical protein
MVFSSPVVRGVDAQISADALRPMPVSRLQCLGLH